jgi:hypothetical protein
MVVTRQADALAALPQGQNPRYPLNRGLSGPQNNSGHFGEIINHLSLAGIKAWMVQPKACYYTDHAIPALLINEVM